MNNTIRITLISAGTSVVASVLVVFISLQAVLPQQGNGLTHTTGSASYVPTTGQEASVIDVVSRTEPAVASVIIKKNIPVMERITNGNRFDLFFPQYRQNGTKLQEIGGGTAFFISADGLLMTNKHVVSDADAQYSVLLNDGRTLDAKVVGRDASNDVALLKVEGSGFPFLTFAGKGDVKLGQGVVSIGNALGEFRNTVSVGVVSGLERDITAGSARQGTTERLHSIIQTDAAINEGNSGGPLLNFQGKVIGMNTAVASGAENIGFAIPVDDLLRVTESYAQYGRIVRPYLGVRYSPVTADMQKANNLSVDYGVIVAKGATVNDLAVLPNSPASKAGILEGDIILEADGQRIDLKRPLNEAIQTKKPGDTLSLKVWRNGKTIELKATLEEWK